MFRIWLKKRQIISQQSQVVAVRGKNYTLFVGKGSRGLKKEQAHEFQMRSNNKRMKYAERENVSQFVRTNIQRKCTFYSSDAV